LIRAAVVCGHLAGRKKVVMQDYTALAELVAYILGPSSAAAQALAHAAIVKAQGGHGNIFYVEGYWIVRDAATARAEPNRSSPLT
jgi:hypothetical protein